MVASELKLKQLVNQQEINLQLFIATNSLIV